ncbi:MAG: amidohydrolase [Acidobacteria bacterium]|nr:amidohydrolase [Acidobacteriota bacterium]
MPLALSLSGTILLAQTGRNPLESITAGLDRLSPSLLSLYQDLHRQPELSGKEVKTAARMAGELRKAGFEVATGVGGTGVVGVLRNGAGPVLLLRTELDALPVEEKTGLPFASQVPGVMHACGHDLHMACWLGAATVLAGMKDRWRGTLLMVGQPAEEIVEGARAMISDGLFTRFPKPTAALALHDRADLPAGRVSWVAGYAMANVDSVDVTVFGRGSHGARPELSVDPVLIAARTVLALQTLVSREKDPLEPAVLTVGSIHGGTKHNIIPDEVKLQMTVRSYAPAVRKLLLSGIGRIARAEALAAGAPKEPAVVYSEGQEATWNDPALTRRLAARLARELGPENVVEGRPDMVAEDFGEFGKAAGIPSVLLRFGAADPARVQAGGPLPSLHSGHFAPLPGPAIRTGATVLALAALEILDGTENKK